MQTAELPLRDIHAAPLPPWWPPAWGWWVLLAVALAGLAWAAVLLWRQRQRRRYRRQLLVEVDQVVNQWQSDRNDAKAIAALSVVLRRLIVHAGNRPDLAGTAGEPWVAELKQVVADQPRLVAAAESLASAPYARQPQAIAIADIASLARCWVAEVSRV